MSWEMLKSGQNRLHVSRPVAAGNQSGEGKATLGNFGYSRAVLHEHLQVGWVYITILHKAEPSILSDSSI